MTMRKKLFGTALLIVCTQLLFIVFILGSISKHNTLKNTNDKLLQANTEIESRMTELVKTKTSMLNVFAQFSTNLIERGALDRQEVSEAMITMADDIKDFNAVYLLYEPNEFDGADKDHVNDPFGSPTGRVAYAVYNRGGKSEFENLAIDSDEIFNEEAYQAVLLTKKIAFSEVQVRNIDGKEVSVVNIASPIFKNGEVVGAVCTDIFIDDISSFISKYKYFEQFELLIVSPEGSMITSDTNKLEKDFFGIAETYKETDNKNLKISDNVRYKGTSYVSSILSVNLNGKDGFEIICAIPYSEVFGRTNNFIFTAIVATVIECLLMLGALYYIIGQFIKPVEFLTEVSEKMCHGEFDYDKDVKYEGNDEIGKLSKNFRSMSDKINELLTDVNIMLHEKKRVNGLCIIDESKYEGIFLQLVKTFNSFEIANEENIELFNASVQKIIDGDFDIDVQDVEGDYAEFYTTLELLAHELKEFNQQVEIVMFDALIGNLYARLDENDRKGSWQELNVGINKVLDSFLIPIEETTKVLQNAVESGYTERVQGSYYGEFATFKKTVNEMLEQLYVNHENMKSRQENLRTQAVTDSLTGLYNRYYFEEIKELLIRKNDKYPKISVLIMDIDKFKDVNDTYGHDVGDEVLRGLATEISEELRVTETLIRWGGEEFLVICRNADENIGILIAERLRKKFSTIDFDQVGNKTVSIGVAEVNLGDDILDTIKRADLALYEAKNTGRNRVVSYSSIVVNE